MKIEPAIRANICLNAHPLGCKEYVARQIAEAKQQTPFQGPKNVLIIGGSSGYGLSSRIALAFGANANTLNVSFESPPSEKRTGSAGWWNNYYFRELAKETNHIHLDLVLDAFRKETKEEVIHTIKQHFGSIDLVVYSLASPARINEETNEIVRSAIKSRTEPVVGNTMDVTTRKIFPITVDVASDQETADTVFVMGGGDWANWIHALFQASLLSKGVKTIAYTYIGGPSTSSIYRHGTLGKAKEHLEETAVSLNQLLQDALQGEALISSSKAVVTKASVFIPQMPIYVSCIYDVLLRKGKQETILQHKYRLFQDMVYGSNRITDDQKRIRLDHIEMEPQIQEEALSLMKNTSEEAFKILPGTELFIQEFYQLNGFGFDHVDYEADIDPIQLAK